MLSTTAAGAAPSILPYFPTLKQKLDLRSQFLEITEDLNHIEERIRAQAREFDPGIENYVSYTLASSGKRIRPALGLLTARATGSYQSGHLDLGVIVELIHMATLVHDDIMDEASRRRGQPTAYAKWGAEISVLLGDCLFCQALKLCANFKNPEISKTIATAANEVCTGEILQTQRRFDFSLSQADYLRIIGMKTAALFRISTELAATVAECPKESVDALRLYGQNLGIAYQIYDDCLDLIGTEETIGKTVGTDLKKGKLTLPILHTLGQASETERTQLQETILHGSDADRLQLLALVVQRGGLQESVNRINIFLEEARAALVVLPPSSYRHSLEAIPQALSDHLSKIG